MPQVIPAGVLLTAADCARLDALLMRALREAQLRDGAIPRSLLDVAADIHHLAGEYRASVLVGHGSGTALAEIGSAGGSSAVMERLTVQQAARLTGTSESYLRRLARRGDVQASRTGRRGEWQLDGGTLAAWAAGRDDRKAG